MDTKIPQKNNGVQPNGTQKSRANLRKLKRGYRDVARFPGRTYFLILITTVILLFAFLTSFFVVLFKVELNNANFPYGANADEAIDTSVKTVGGNLPGKTVSKRASYISDSSSNRELISSEIGARNVILIDLDTNKSIAEKSADTKIYPASMTKVMSLLVACETLRTLAKELVVTQEVVDYSVKMGGSGVGLKVGDKLIVRDLLYLTAYQSDTVAVIMLANFIAGSEANFVKLMNDKANQLGLKNTKFANCTGLHSPNNYTTCREMAAIFAYALENPLCKELLTSYEKYKAGKYTIYSSWYSGRFSDNPNLKTVRVLGGKTGYIDESGFCLVSLAEGKSTGKKYIQVITGQPKGNGYREELSVKDIKYVYNNYAT